jgi:hypothetical protein
MRVLARSLLLLSCYVGVVIWLTWPLAPQAATDAPQINWACRFDPTALA